MGRSQQYSFALCLSHDVDRIYKTYQYFSEAIKQRDPYQLLDALSPENPYWTFERIMSIEDSLGVRSSFNILDEIHITQRPISEWFTKRGWKLFAGRYNIKDPQFGSLLQLLDGLGWEIGLHGSFTSSENPERFKYEKKRIESVAETEIVGNRQHYWRLSRPDTWKHLRDAGIKYDTSLGSSTEIEFEHGHEIIRPFNDEFVVFPWTLMDGAVMGSAETTSEIWSNCRRVLEEAKENQSVVVADWHGGNIFYERDYPGWAEMYERLIEAAIEMGAWVGPPREFYRAIPHPDGTITEALSSLANEHTDD